MYLSFGILLSTSFSPHFKFSPQLTNQHAHTVTNHTPYITHYHAYYFSHYLSARSYTSSVVVEKGVVTQVIGAVVDVQVCVHMYDMCVAWYKTLPSPF